MEIKIQTFFLLIVFCVQGGFSSTTYAEGEAEVVFETSKGSFTLSLDPVKAPKTVKNFLRYVDEGYYNNTVFHRAIPGFVIQGGGFEKGMKHKSPHKPVKNESANRLKNTRGTISMARRSHPDTATSQFYINLAENKNLDYKSKVQPGYTVFGEITSGMNVIDKIASIPTHNVERFRDVPKEDVVVISAKRKKVESEADEDVSLGNATDSLNSGLIRYIEGEHYTVLESPVSTRDSNKIEVVEMFTYGCPHCYEFEAHLKEWGKKQVNDVDFWFFPAVWNKSMKLYAKAFYTAEELNISYKVHEPLFNAIVVEQKSIRNKNDLSAIFVKYGVDKKDFDEVFDSALVEKKALESERKVKSYKPAGAPELVVNGKYRIDRMRAGGLTEMLAIADFLINKERETLKNN